MSSANAERQRRYRAHKRGDHSICLPGYCDGAGASPEPAPEPVATSERGERGTTLWRALANEVGPAHRVLLDEACRIVDRLDRLDAVLAGRADWLRVEDRSFGENVKVTVTVDGVLAEARQQVNALRGIVTELRTAGAVKTRTRTSEPQKSPEEGSLADLLSFAARRRSPAG